MSIEVFNLVIKVAILMLLAGASEFTLSIRRYGVTVFLFTVYLSVFRRTMLAAISAYVGLFKHATPSTMMIQNFLMSGLGVTFTDVLLLLGTLFLFFEQVKSYKKYYTDGK